MGMCIRKIIHMIPTIAALLFYMALGFLGSFSAVSPWVWFWIAILFFSSVLMIKGQWYGCIGGLVVGCVLIYSSTQYTGQVIDIERPLGILLCVYYLICGIHVRKKIEKRYSL